MVYAGAGSPVETLRITDQAAASPHRIRAPRVSLAHALGPSIRVIRLWEGECFKDESWHALRQRFLRCIKRCGETSIAHVRKHNRSMLILR
jgi:hypothetical protein